MWQFTRQLLSGDRTEHYAVQRDGVPVSYRDALKYWQEDETFRSSFISILASTKFTAFRWETPPITNLNADRDFEFVLIDAPRLERKPDGKPFSKQFADAGKNHRVVTFANLGGDAVLVVPCPAGPADAYGHLAAFVRHAPAAQVHELWQAVGAAVSARLSAEPVWLSTAGMGVSWLHVRLDSQPKYYGFARYAEEA